MNTTAQKRAGAREEKGFTVGEWVARHPQTARVFERHSIDYCCAGKRSLEDACGPSGVDAAAVRSELRGMARNAPPGVSMDWGGAPLGVLIEHIVSSHHHFLRTEEQRLVPLAAEVAKVHGDRHAELEVLADIVNRIFGELRPHLEAEERDFFPACRRWDSEPGAVPPPELLAGLAEQETEHAAAGAKLERIRALTSGFKPPPDACDAYRALFRGLERLEADIHEHIHKENNILHARVRARIAGDAGGKV